MSHELPPTSPDGSGATAIPEHVPTGPLWSELRDAIRGTGADYTRIPMRRAVFLLAVPMVLELVLESTSPWSTSTSSASSVRRPWRRWG